MGPSSGGRRPHPHSSCLHHYHGACYISQDACGHAGYECMGFHQTLRHAQPCPRYLAACARRCYSVRAALRPCIGNRADPGGGDRGGGRGDRRGGRHADGQRLPGWETHGIPTAVLTITSCNRLIPPSTAGRKCRSAALLVTGYWLYRWRKIVQCSKPIRTPGWL
jgi:hypothetical protein